MKANAAFSAKALSNPELLALVLGKAKGEKMAMTPLAELFGLRMRRRNQMTLFQEPADYAVPDTQLAAIKELMVRAIGEEMHDQPVTLNSPATVKDYLCLLLGGVQHEVFVVLFLDTQHRVIASEELFRGTLSQTSVYPREVVKRALMHNAAAVILSHNHPSGVSEPSQADKTLTNALKQALNLVDVRVLDHIIVADGNGTLSFAERGLI